VTDLLQLAAQAAGLFIFTDLDDVLVLLGFMADPRFRMRQIVTGQYIGIAILFCASVAGSWLSFVVPPAYIGLLGIVPIAMGFKAAWELREPVALPEPSGAAPRANVAAVVAMTVANGGDNVSVYVPLFAMRSAFDIAVTAAVFAVMTALWLALAYWLTRHRSIGAPVRRCTRVLMPFVFIALGVFILAHAWNRNL
jgi:cadmium resistance protein CadD (predicted permease)